MSSSGDQPPSLSSGHVPSDSGSNSKSLSAPLSKITADPVDNKHKIVGLAEPKPRSMPKDMLQGIKARAFRRRGLLPPEVFPDS
jgi:hypothetical protein